MAFMDWKESYSVGIAAIDGQHKILVGMINTLYEHMKAGKSGEVIEKLLAALIDYTQVHFKTEEDLFAAKGYPQAAAHEAKHAAFVEKVGKFNEDYKAKKIGLSVQLLEFLTDWLKEHIQLEDKAYSPYLSGKD
jgi:hemerythrin